MEREIPVVVVDTPTERLAAQARPSRAIFPILVGFLILWLLLDRTAAALNSLRGEAGIFLAFLVVGAALMLEILLFKRSARTTLRALGFGRPPRSSLPVSSLIALLLLAYFPIYSAITGTPLTLRENWFLFLPGLFAQGGIAEEVIFRGFVFRHLREGRAFRQAAFLSMLLFAVAHLYMFTTMSAPVALAALLLSVISAVPLAGLFERGGNTIWAPALIHFVIQGAIKVVVIPETSMMAVSVGWMGACAMVPYLVFAFRPASRALPSQEPSSTPG